MSASPELDIISRDHSESDRFEFHPKLRARLSASLAQQQQQLESCKPEELAQRQAMVSALRMMLALPEQMKQEERNQLRKEQR